MDDTKVVNIHPFKEAGCRLQAAVISYQMGYKGVDSPLKTQPEVVDKSWAELAERLIRGMSQEHADRINPPLKSKTIQ
jgi:hypothetical protein